MWWVEFFVLFSKIARIFLRIPYVFFIFRVYIWGFALHVLILKVVCKNLNILVEETYVSCKGEAMFFVCYFNIVCSFWLWAKTFSSIQRGVLCIYYILFYSDDRFLCFMFIFSSIYKNNVLPWTLSFHTFKTMSMSLKNNNLQE